MNQNQNTDAPAELPSEAPASHSPTSADLAEIVQLFDEAILVLDGAQRVVFFNDSAQALFGYPPAELLGQASEQLFAHRQRGVLSQLIAEFGEATAPPTSPHSKTKTRHTTVGLRQDGSEFSADVALLPLRQTGHGYWAVILRDLTEQEQAERQLRLKSDALENSLTAFGIVDLDGQFVYANDTYLRLWGFDSLDDLMETSAATHAADPAVMASVIDTIEQQGHCSLEFTARRKDGSTFETLMSVKKSTNALGEAAYVGTAIDITHHKRTTQHLAEQKELLETILQQAADAIVVCDAQDNPILINAAACRLALGESYDQTEVSPKFLWGKACYPDGHPIPLQAWPLEQALRGNTISGAEARLVRPDGSHHDVLISAAPIRNTAQRIMGAVAIFSDITERKHVEEQLLYQLRLNQGITESATESIFVTDAKGRVTFLNPEAQRVFGFTPAELLGEVLHNKIHYRYPDGRPLLAEECRLGRIYLTGETIRDQENIFFRKDGTPLIMTCSSAVLENKGKRVGAVFFMRDITNRRRDEQAFQESAARLRAIVSAVPDLLLVLDDEGRYLEILAQPHLLAADPIAIKGRLLSEILPAAAAEQALTFIRKTLATGEPQTFESELLIRKIGQRHFQVRTAPLDGLFLGKPAVILLARDITQQRLTELSLRHAQKMEAVGQLTGGIAHDFNNLLAVILGNLELLAEALTEPALQELVQRALGAVERGATLIRRLLTFSRRQPLQPQPVNLNTLVLGISDLVQRSLGETITVDTILGDNLLPTLIDPNEFESALLNLVVNARDAMPNGGRLMLETANRWLDEDQTRQHFFQVKPGQYVMLAVSDTGTGMSPEVLEHAFEPFFTTKDVGHGSGLGLSMVYGLVKQSDGHIHIYSEVQQGTSIRIFLPAVTAPVNTTLDQLEAQPPLAPGQGQTVLVVEDEAPVRRLAVYMLQSLGYKTAEADTAAAALAVLATTPRIAVLFTDIVLPGGQSGVELAQKALQSHPELVILFTSGYTETHLLRFQSRPAGSGFLSKPYRKAELASKLRDLLIRQTPPV